MDPDNDPLCNNGIPAETQPIPGEVNVIFRGLFLFIQRSLMIDVLIPNLGIEHTYRAGFYLGEKLLQPRSISEPYVLQGVTKGAEMFQGITFPGYDYKGGLTMADVHARIVLPTPKEILSFRPLVGDGPLDVVDPFGALTKDLNTVYVFRYDGDLARTSLARHMQPTATAAGSFRLNGGNDGPLCMNIHVIADPEENNVSQHPVHGFTKAMNLLQGIEGTICIRSAQSMKLQDIDKVEVPEGKGILSEELLSFGEQRVAQIEVGLAKRTKQGGDGTAVNPPNGCAPLWAGGGTKV
jgi:hypothetical protein